MENLNITSYKGNITQWAIYHKDILDPINKYFKTASESEFTFIRDNLSTNLEVITEWSSWGRCQVCEYPLGQAIKTRTGFCHIKTKKLNQQKHSVRI